MGGDGATEMFQRVFQVGHIIGPERMAAILMCSLAMRQKVTTEGCSQSVQFTAT